MIFKLKHKNKDYREKVVRDVSPTNTNQFLMRKISILNRNTKHQIDHD